MKKKYSEQVLDWCDEFEKEIFLSSAIKTESVHFLGNEYIKLRNKFENKKYFLENIQAELLKRANALKFFNHDQALLSKELKNLFSSEFKNVDIDQALSPFKKDIIKSVYSPENITEIHPQEASILYDLGVADWDYVKSHFTHKIKDSYLHEAVAWITTYIQSGDFDPEKIIEKNGNGKVLKNKTFLNILEDINNKALTNKPPFDITDKAVYYNKSHNTSLDVKLWNEKKQSVYGAVSTRNRDFSGTYKSIEGFYHIAAENLVIKAIKEKRNEFSPDAEKVRNFLKMKLYTEIKNNFLELSKKNMPLYESNEVFTNLDENLMIVKGGLNKDIFYKNQKTISPLEIKTLVQDLKMEKSCLYFTDLLSKNPSEKGELAGSFLKGHDRVLKGKGYLSISEETNAEIIKAIYVEFSGYKKTGFEKAQFESLLYGFFVEDSFDITKRMSEKSVYKEEREVLFQNLNDMLVIISEKGLKKGLENYFSNLSEEQLSNLESIISGKDFYKEFKKKIEDIRASQHESSIHKNTLLEKAFNVGIGFNPNLLGNFIKDEDTEKSNESGMYSDLKEWCDRFIEDVLFEKEFNDIGKVIIEEYMELKETYNSFDTSSIVKEMLLNDERLEKIFPQKKKGLEFLNGIFSGEKTELSLSEDSINLKKNIPFNFKATSGFLSNQDQITKWGFISKYFDKTVKKSTIKEASGWLLGFLKHGDVSAYKFSKSENVSQMLPDILERINQMSLTANKPFILEGNKIRFQEARAGEVDVEFWDAERNKINGMSITRHQGVEIEGNQFIRHPMKLFVKAIMLEKSGNFENPESIKNTRINDSEIKDFIDNKLLKDKVSLAINNGDEFAKNITVAREYIRQKYGINYHENGFRIGESEMDLLLNEMSQKVNYSFFGEIRGKASLPELNAGLTNIAYLENLRNIGNFNLSVKSSEMFMGYMNKYYNGVDNEANIEETSKKVLFNLFRKNPMNDSVIEYFSEPNAHKDERETLIQSIGVLIDKLREDYDLNDASTLKASLDDFFKDIVTEEEKESFLVDFKNGNFYETLRENLSKLKLSYGEPKKRYDLLEEKMQNSKIIMNLDAGENLESPSCSEIVGKRKKVRVCN